MMLWDVLSFWGVVLIMSLDLLFRIEFHPKFSTYQGFGASVITMWLHFFSGEPIDARHAYFFEMLTCILGLTSLPFLVFLLPQVGSLVLRMRPTGYNQAGELRLMLSQRRMKKKFLAEKRRDEMAHLDLDGDGVVSLDEHMVAWANNLKSTFTTGASAARAAKSLQ